MDGLNFGSKPGVDECEVTLIGPGYGEAVIVHIGDDRWLLIDSCTPSKSKADRPCALTYLEAIGVDPSNVFCIVVSHWDDDHVRGLAKVVAACTNAELVFSRAMANDEFVTLVASFDCTPTEKIGPGAKEMLDTLRHLAETGRKPGPIAMPDRRLFRFNADELSHGEGCEVWSLSPSDFEHTNFLNWVAAEMPSVGQSKRRAVARIRNDLSTVIYVSLGGDSILLGGDLEEEGRPDSGWSAILESPGRPTQLASLFKVPHHGSPTGDHPSVWKEMLTPNPYAVVAPFKSGKTSLPAVSDVKRICSNTDNAFATTSLAARAPMKRDPSVQKMINSATKSFSAIYQDPGILRCRRSLSTSAGWTIERFARGVPLADVHA